MVLLRTKSIIMVRIIVILVLLTTFSFTAKADAWDNLTLTEAEAVVAHLGKNPYIFQYCDCCDDDSPNINSAILVKVTKTSIEKCDWNDEMYSVYYDAEIIAEISYTESGLKISSGIIEGSSTTSDKIYMNYTRTINPSTKKATNFFNIIDYQYYGESTPCKAEFDYPNPKALKAISTDKKYKKWYTKATR